MNWRMTSSFIVNWCAIYRVEERATVMPEIPVSLFWMGHFRSCCPWRTRRIQLWRDHPPVAQDFAPVVKILPSSDFHPAWGTKKNDKPVYCEILRNLCVPGPSKYENISLPSTRYVNISGSSSYVPEQLPEEDLHDDLQFSQVPDFTTAVTSTPRHNWDEDGPMLIDVEVMRRIIIMEKEQQRQ